jgi:hypothetical protein
MPSDHARLEAALREAEASLATLPRFHAHLLYSRAHALDGLGRNEEAIRAYTQVLHVDASHFDALTGIGRLLLNAGNRTAAKTALERAVHVQPDSATAHANLGTVLSDDDDARARLHYERALALDPEHRSAHRGLAILLLRDGQPEAARTHGRAGFGGALEAWQYRGAGRPVSLLLVMAAVGGNVPIEPLLDDRIFLRWTLAPEFFDASAELPPHDVVFNAVGDADRCGQALDAASAALARSVAPVLNRPSRVKATSRAANAARLARVDGVATARVAEWERETLLAPDAPDGLERGGFRWPLLVRSRGFHTGEHFVKVDEPTALAAAVHDLPGENLLVIEFVETRSADGMYRKYRTMMIGGELYPLHLAVSQSWKVHYFSADMAERAEHRAEDAAFLADMPGVLGSHAMRALEAVRDALDLDYGGIDFALDAAGRVVVFEANATMVLIDPPADARWDYRRAPVDKAKKAFQRMLLAAAGRLADGPV